MWRLRPKRIQPSAVSVVATVIALGLQIVGGWRTLDRAGYVMLFQARQLIAPLSWDSRVAVIAIDDATLGRYGQFPISRRYYVDLLNQLIVAQPAALGFDLLFTESSPYDEALAAAIARHWTVVLPLAVTPQGSVLQPVPLLATAAAAQGHVQVTPDTDGITRSLDLHQGDIPAFSLALVEIYRQAQAATATDGAWGQSPSLAEVPRKGLWLNWPAPVQAPPGCALPEAGPAQVYSMACVLSGEIPVSTFSNRIVLIGVTATGVDPLRTPFNVTPPTSNVYLHAAAIDNLLNGRSLIRPPAWLLLPSLALMSFGAAGLISRSKGVRFAVLGLPFAWGALALVSFLAGVWLPVAAPIGTVILAAIGAQASAQWEKQQLMALFSIHVDPGTAELLWQQRRHILEEGHLPVQDIVATILFVDIRGFTTVSELLPSQTLMRWLNCYLEAITAQITAQGGVVDKFIGDEVMAYFGVPAADADQAAVSACATRALAASLGVYRSVQQLNQRLLQEGYSSIDVGIGIHTGLASAGSVGGRHRLNYSIVGDAVNVAARLEELNKIVIQNNPYSLLMSEATYFALRANPSATNSAHHYAYHYVGRFRLKGRAQRVVVYTLQPVSVQAIS